MSNGERVRFGSLLRQRRRARGLTQEELAEQAGLGVRTIQDLEAGATHPMPDSVARLARVLGLDTEEHATFLAAGARRPRREGSPPVRAGPDGPAALPVALTALVGREHDLAAICRLLAEGTRLLTLTGPGGIGKTRLALAIAAEVSQEDHTSVGWVELAPLADPALVPQAVAAALGVRERAGRPRLSTLVDALRRRRLLLVVDNCEHLLDSCAALADALLRACPEVQLLATSREALGMVGERIYLVPALSLPPTEEPLAMARLPQYGAIQLLLERAALVAPDFTLTERNAIVVAQLCRRLDGIPLALELAAARLEALSVEDLFARLEQRFRLLGSGNRAAPPRQRTLRATVDWSYDLLTAAERTLFARLAVFAGGWSLDAAEAVCAGGDIAREAVAELHARLVERSLVESEPRVAGERRYRLLETLRQYALERLDQAATADDVRERHADYYLALAEAAAPPGLDADIEHYLAVLEREHENLRAANRWLLARRDAERGPRLCAALLAFWRLRGYLAEGLNWLQAMLAQASPALSPRTRARGLRLASQLAWNQGDLAAASNYAAAAVAAGREVAEPGELARALLAFCFVARETGPLAAVRAAEEESLALALAARDDAGVAGTLFCMGITAHVTGDYVRAQALYEEASALPVRAGSPQCVAWSYHHLGCLALNRGDLTVAETLLRQDLRLEQELGNRPDWVEALALLASLAAERQQWARAVRLLAAVDQTNEVMGHRMQRMVTRTLDGWVERAQAALRPEEAVHVQAEGAAMSLEEATAYALEEGDS